MSIQGPAWRRGGGRGLPPTEGTPHPRPIMGMMPRASNRADFSHSMIGSLRQLSHDMTIFLAESVNSLEGRNTVRPLTWPPRSYADPHN